MYYYYYYDIIIYCEYVGIPSPQPTDEPHTHTPNFACPHSEYYNSPWNVIQKIQIVQLVNALLGDVINVQMDILANHLIIHVQLVLLHLVLNV